MYIIEKTLPEAYHSAIKQFEGNVKLCPAYNTRTLEAHNPPTIIIEEPLSEPMISRLIPCDARSLQQYEMEIVDGILDFMVGHGHWHYTYHSRIDKYLQFVIDELTKDPNSRRAIISVRDNDLDAYSDNPACLQSIHFYIEDGKLSCAVLFRSNDFLNATYMNMYGLIRLQESIAKKLHLPIGRYIHRVTSLHVYEKNWKTLQDYKRALSVRTPEEVTYTYTSFNLLMEASIPEIEKLVDNLRLKYRK